MCGTSFPYTAEYFPRNKTKRYGLDSTCRPCNVKRVCAWHQANRERSNKARFASWRRAYARNPEKHRARVAAYRRGLSPAAAAARRERINAWRRATPEQVISRRISALLGRALHGKKSGRSWQALVGYTRDELLAHLERLFQPGMSWSNVGQWHVDHVRPIASFSFRSAEDAEFKACWALSNLQPLWARENQQKSAKWPSAN